MSYQARGEFDEGISVTTLENEMQDGYSSSALFGSPNGLRTWRLRMPTLAGGNLVPSVPNVHGEQVSREEYLWDLFMESKTSGSPFVFQSPRNGQFYLVRFADRQLSYAGMRVQIYSTGIELKQVRIGGVSVFDPGKLFPAARDAMAWFDQTQQVADTWTPKRGVVGLGPLTRSGDAIFGGATQNGLPVVRFNSTGTTGIVQSASMLGLAIRDLLIVLRINEATFGQTAGIISTSGGLQLLTGENGTTRFADVSLGSFYQFRLDGVERPASDQQAPMERFGVVHLRFSDPDEGFFMDDLRIGTIGGSPGTHAKMDVAEMVITNELLSVPSIRELVEHLAIRWGIPQP
jgi:hypothetical protein